LVEDADLDAPEQRVRRLEDVLATQQRDAALAAVELAAPEVRPFARYTDLREPVLGAPLRERSRPELGAIDGERSRLADPCHQRVGCVRHLYQLLAQRDSPSVTRAHHRSTSKNPSPFAAIATSSPFRRSRSRNGASTWSGPNSTSRRPSLRSMRSSVGCSQLRGRRSRSSASGRQRRSRQIENR